MGKDKTDIPLFVPGRLCLFGEHSDWAAEYGRHNGLCLVIGTDQGLSAVATASDKFVVETQVPDPYGNSSGRVRKMTCPCNSETLLEAARDQDEFFRYCAGTAYEMISHPGVTGGLNLRITAMDLPLGKGVSSSAAVCILVAKAFDSIYKLGLFPHELMETAYLGEKLTGSQCGRMDQACIYGKVPVLLTFQKDSGVRVEPVFPAKEMQMFIVDLAGRKDTLQILGDLQGAYLSSKPLQQALGEENERIIRKAYRAMSIGDAPEFGSLMTESQRLFDKMIAPISPDQLSSPLLHEILAFEGIAGHIYGGKGVGSHGDGTAQFVARSAADRDEAMRKISEKFAGMHCFPLTILPQGPNGHKN